MRTTYGYDAYRGRSRGRTVLTVLAVLLAVVLALAVAFFLFAQRYIVYTDDGRAHLELPFLQREAATPTLEPLPSQDLVIITASPEPTPTPQPELRAVWLLRGALTDGTAQAQVEQMGGNAAVFNMKADDGTLGYVSDLPQAIAFGVSASEPGLNDSVRALTGGELYTIARVSCFKDNKAPRQNNALALKTNSGYNWRDPEGMRWMNVSIPEARAYVAGVCRELAALGFDEILLENTGYPTEGNLNHIKKGTAYDPGNLSGPVGQFYAEAAQALADYPQVKLSLSVGAGALGEEGDLSGQTSELLGQYAYRLYVPQPEQAGNYTDALRQAGLDETQVVYLVPSGEAAAAGGILVKPRETPTPAATAASRPSSTPVPSAEAVPASTQVPSAPPVESAAP